MLEWLRTGTLYAELVHIRKEQSNLFVMALITASDYHLASDLIGAIVDAQKGVDKAQLKLDDARRTRSAIAAELHRNGISAYRIARVLGMTAPTVQVWIKEAGNA